MGLWQRVRNLWTGELLTRDQLDQVVEESVSKALDTPTARKLKKYGVDLKGQHKHPYEDMIEAGGNGPRKRFGFRAEVLRAVAHQNPWLRAAIDIRKREVAGSDWDVVPKLGKYADELKEVERLVRSARRFEDRWDKVNNYKPYAIENKQLQELLEACKAPSLSDIELRYRFTLALQDRRRQADTHCAVVRRLFQYPNRNPGGWGHLQRALIPDLLILDSANIEKRRADIKHSADGRPGPESPILELHWVDGATIRPCLDEYGMLRGMESEDPTELAYEQWVESTRVQSPDGTPIGWRIHELLHIVENPTTDLRWMGYGFSRVESLVMTSMLEAFADSEDKEEFTRGMYGGFLHIKDKSFSQEDLSAFRSWIEDELEGTKKLPILAFEDVGWVSTSPHAAGRDKKGVEKLKRYVQRVCAVFEMSPTKLAQHENSNRATSQTGQENDDDGLRNLLQVWDDAMTNGLVADFGYEDVRYMSNPSHERDEEKRLENTKKKLEQGIWSVNDAKIEWGEDPIEEGDQPYLYLKTYWEEKGRAEGQAAGAPEQDEAGAEPDGEDDLGLDDIDGAEGDTALDPTPDGPGDQDAFGDDAQPEDDSSTSGGSGLSGVSLPNTTESPAPLSDTDQEEETEKALKLQLHRTLEDFRHEHPHEIPQVTIEVKP